MIPHALGGAVGRKGARNSAIGKGLVVDVFSPRGHTYRRIYGIDLIVLVKKLLPVPAEEQLRAGRRYNRWAFCPFAICGIAPYAGNDLPACGRKQLLQLIQAALVPKTNLCLGSNDSVRRAFA